MCYDPLKVAIQQIIEPYKVLVTCSQTDIHDVTDGLFIETSLLILTNLADYFVIEVLDDMKVIKNRLNLGALFLKCLFKIRVHIAGNSFNSIHLRPT